MGKTLCIKIFRFCLWVEGGLSVNKESLLSVIKTTERWFYRFYEFKCNIVLLIAFLFKPSSHRQGDLFLHFFLLVLLPSTLWFRWSVFLLIIFVSVGCVVPWVFFPYDQRVHFVAGAVVLPSVRTVTNPHLWVLGVVLSPTVCQCTGFDVWRFGLGHFSWGGLAGLWVLLWVPHPWCITALEVLSAFSSCALMGIFLLPSQVQWGRRSNLDVSAVEEQGAGLHCSNNVIQEGLLVPNSSLLSHLRICFKPSPSAF